MNKKKKTIVLIGLSLVTLVLAGVAVLTAWKLRQISVEEEKPTVVEEPQAQEAPVFPEQGLCYLFFDEEPTNTPTPTPTPTDTPSPTPTNSPTPTPTTIPECWSICETDDDCPSGLVCLTEAGEVNPDEVMRCANEECPAEEDCVCPEPTDTPTPTPTNTGTPTPTPTGTITPAPTDTPAPTNTPAPGETPVPTNTPAPRVEEQELPEAGIISPTLWLALAGIALLGLGLAL
jgi:hypothetical protein